MPVIFWSQRHPGKLRKWDWGGEAVPAL